MFEAKRIPGWLSPGLGLCAALAGVAGCDGLTDDVDGFSNEDWKQVQQIAPLSGETPRNPFNKRDLDPAVARLGQMLFFETDLAEGITVDNSPVGKKGETGKIGCVSCHDPNKSFIDTRPYANPLSYGRGAPLRRNTPAMVNLGYYTWVGWTGRNDSMVMHGAGVWSLSASALSYSHYLYKKYREEYNATFPDNPLDPALDPMAPDAKRFPPTGAPKAAGAPDGAWEMMAPDDQKIIQQIQANLGRVWDAYPRMLVTRNSPFERYVAGDYTALNPRAKNGLRLFIGKAACNDCHNGPILSDNKFHNIGVPTPATATAQDMGRFPDMGAAKTNIFSSIGVFSDNREEGNRKLNSINTADVAMTGAFRTPGLLNIADTGPYFHTGEFKTLEEVVRHYNKGGGEAGSFAGPKDPRLKPLDLTEEEQADLVEFLKHLTGELPDEWRKDTAKH
jgi:cytochrome c peroxidase